MNLEENVESGGYENDIRRNEIDFIGDEYLRELLGLMKKSYKEYKRWQPLWIEAMEAYVRLIHPEGLKDYLFEYDSLKQKYKKQEEQAKKPKKERWYSRLRRR